MRVKKERFFFSLNKMFARQLHILMGEAIWESFANFYAQIARGDGLRKGYDTTFYVNNIIKWYHKSRNEMDPLTEVSHIFCDGRMEMNYHLTLWNEFKEMWIDSTKDQQVELLCQLNKFQTLNMYQVWNLLK